MENNDTLYYSLNNEEETQIDYRNSNYKLIKFSFDSLKDKEIIIRQDIHQGKGGIFWDGSYITAKILLEQYVNKDNLNILELGSGTSLPSLACAMKSKGSNIIISDIEKTMKLRESIISDNKCNFIGTVQNINLDFESTEDRHNVSKLLDNNSLDIIICSELIYLDELFDSIINTIKYFCSKETKVILTYRERLPEQIKLFFDKFDQSFTKKEIFDKDIEKFSYKKKMTVIEAMIK